MAGVLRTMTMQAMNPFGTYAASAGKLAVLAAMAIGLSACGGLQAALGVGKNAPDEFAVVTKAPLIIPPDFSLRPPKPGAPRPQELQPTETARMALMGKAEGEGSQEGGPSAGELTLLRNAKADRVDPNIRDVLNDESGRIREKDDEFTNTVLFGESGQIADTAESLEPPSEQETEQEALDEDSDDVEQDAATDPL
ncbi:MAG: DUF3035 domain-containing protein [Alphaproteobacteria bacterium]|nr:MAG: DUF3035 domain-containing protein [Alphaproteobacteria bacterium]